MTLMKIYIKEDNVMRVNKSKFKLKLNKMVENLEENSKRGMESPRWSWLYYLCPHDDHEFVIMKCHLCENVG